MLCSQLCSCLRYRTFLRVRATSLAAWMQPREAQIFAKVFHCKSDKFSQTLKPSTCFYLGTQSPTLASESPPSTVMDSRRQSLWSRARKKLRSTFCCSVPATKGSEQPSPQAPRSSKQEAFQFSAEDPVSCQIAPERSSLATCRQRQQEIREETLAFLAKYQGSPGWFMGIRVGPSSKFEQQSEGVPSSSIPDTTASCSPSLAGVWPSQTSTQTGQVVPQSAPVHEPQYRGRHFQEPAASPLAPRRQDRPGHSFAPAAGPGPACRAANPRRYRGRVSRGGQPHSIRFTPKDTPNSVMHGCSGSLDSQESLFEGRRSISMDMVGSAAAPHLVRGMLGYSMAARALLLPTDPELQSFGREPDSPAPCFSPESTSDGALPSSSSPSSSSSSSSLPSSPDDTGLSQHQQREPWLQQQQAAVSESEVVFDSDCNVLLRSLMPQEATARRPMAHHQPTCASSWQPESCYLVLSDEDLHASHGFPWSSSTWQQLPRLAEAALLLLLILTCTIAAMSFGVLSMHSPAAGAHLPRVSPTLPLVGPSATLPCSLGGGSLCTGFQGPDHSSFSQPAGKPVNISTLAVLAQEASTLSCLSPWAEFPPLPAGFFELHGIIKPRSQPVASAEPEHPREPTPFELGMPVKAEPQTSPALCGREAFIPAPASSSSSSSCSCKRTSSDIGRDNRASDVRSRVFSAEHPPRGINGQDHAAFCRSQPLQPHEAGVEALQPPRHHHSPPALPSRRQSLTATELTLGLTPPCGLLPPTLCPGMPQSPRSPLARAPCQAPSHRSRAEPCKWCRQCITITITTITSTQGSTRCFSAIPTVASTITISTTTITITSGTSTNGPMMGSSCWMAPSWRDGAGEGCRSVPESGVVCCCFCLLWAAVGLNFLLSWRSCCWPMAHV